MPSLRAQARKIRNAPRNILFGGRHKQKLPAIIEAWLAGECAEANLARESGCEAPAVGQEPTLELMEPVWLFLGQDFVNPFTGTRGMWAAAMVLGLAPTIAGNEGVLVVTERMHLKGVVPKRAIRHREPGEIAPGRSAFSIEHPGLPR